MSARRAIGLLCCIATLLLSGLAAPAPAQTVEVRLEVSESTGGIFRSRFESALAGLEDVEVVGRGEPADYLITATVLCLPDAEVCDAADSYSVSVVLSEPLTPRELRRGLSRTGTEVLSGWEASPEAASYLQRFQRIHASWATSWARDRYGASVDRLVRGIDARCFEKRRVYETRRAALLRRGDTLAARNLPPDVVPEEDWLC